MVPRFIAVLRGQTDSADANHIGSSKKYGGSRTTESIAALAKNSKRHQTSRKWNEDGDDIGLSNTWIELDASSQQDYIGIRKTIDIDQTRDKESEGS